ncbi:uncharacterized protein [Amphiura filiformis]|uniref:uncharacterized protein isoform X2 n=1 Tax=Amphiura filiformis TaxID=82378 RepID=UPI003B20E49C
MAANNIQRQRRPKTQPIKFNEETQADTSYKERRATYHTTDNTQSPFQENSSNLTSTTVSTDSGLSSRMSSTPSIQRLDLSEGIRLHFRMLTQEISDEMEQTSDYEENMTIPSSTVNAPASASEVVKKECGNTKDDKNTSLSSDVSDGAYVQTHVIVKHASQNQEVLVRTDSMDSGATEESLKNTDLQTIHEIESEPSDADICDATKCPTVVNTPSKHITLDNSPSSNKPNRRGFYTLWNSLFGRCFHSKKEVEECEAIYQDYEDLRSEKEITETVEVSLENASSIHRPDSGYDSFKANVPSSIAVNNLRTNENITNIPLLSTPQSAHVAELVQSLLQFQTRQRMSPQSLAGRTVRTSYFAGAFLTEKGGRISLPKRNANMYVPPGAISPGNLQLVYIYVLPTDGASSLDDAETWLSQSVHCGPSGLQFNKHVFLTVPHSATDVNDWEFTTHQLKQKDGGVWRRLEDGKETILVRQKDKLTLLMTHFCGQRFSGRPRDDKADATATKMMNVAACINESNTEMKINVCVAYKGENITSLEKRFRQCLPGSYYNPCNESQMFLDKERFKDLCLTLDFLETTGLVGWSAVAGKLGSLNLKLVHGAKQQKDRSETAILLDSFFLTQADEGKEVLETLELLSSVCNEIDSHDAKMIVDEEIEERRQNRAEAATGIVPGTNRTQQHDDQMTTQEISELPVSFVKGCTNNVIVEVSQISPGWRIRGTKRQIVSFHDVWSQRNKFDSSTVSFDVIADDMDTAGLQGKCKASVRVFQESFESKGVTLNLQQSPIQESSKNSNKDHHVVAIDDHQLIQPSSRDLQDLRLRQPFTAPGSQQAWRDLLHLTNIHDNDDDVLEGLTNHTRCPQALALDLFFAVHDTNEEAVLTLQKHDIHVQKNTSNLNTIPTSGDGCKDKVQTPKVKTTMVSWVKNKGKAFFQRKCARYNCKTESVNVETDKHIKEENSSSLSHLKDDQRQGIFNPSFDDLGIDNPAFQVSNSRSAEQHDYPGGFEACSNSPLPGVTDKPTIYPSILLEHPIASDDSLDEETITSHASNGMPVIDEHHGYVRLSTSCHTNLTAISENGLGTFVNELLHPGEPTNKQPDRTCSVLSKDSGFGTFERNSSDDRPNEDFM